MVVTRLGCAQLVGAVPQFLVAAWPRARTRGAQRQTVCSARRMARVRRYVCRRVDWMRLARECARLAGGARVVRLRLWRWPWRTNRCNANGGCSVSEMCSNASRAAEPPTSHTTFQSANVYEKLGVRFSDQEPIPPPFSWVIDLHNAFRCGKGTTRADAYVVVPASPVGECRNEESTPVAGKANPIPEGYTNWFLDRPFPEHSSSVGPMPSPRNHPSPTAVSLDIEGPAATNTLDFIL